MSSRVFIVEDLKGAQHRLLSSERRVITRLANKINKRTKIGYYAALEVVANLGIVLLAAPSSQISTKLSTKPASSSV